MKISIGSGYVASLVTLVTFYFLNIALESGKERKFTKELYRQH